MEIPGIADLTYPESQTRRGRVQEKGKISPTLTTENIPSYIEEWVWRLDKRGVYEKRCRDILQILWEKADQEEVFKWQIGVLWLVLEAEVLRQNLYAKRLFEDWSNREELVKCSLHSKENKQPDPNADELQYLWQEWKARCTPQRWGLAEQYSGELTDIVQKLSYEDTSSQSFVQSMWQTCKGDGILRQALSEIQEIWESDGSEEAEWYCIRIRKLTPRCCWRLMSFTDEDFDKAAEVMSNSSLYKQAGNSIVTDVLCAIFREML